VTLGLVHLSLSLASNLVVYRFSRALLPYLSIRLVLPRREHVARIVGYGKYVLVNNIGQKLVFVSDSFVIGMFMPISALTYYAIAGSLVDYLRSSMNAMASVVNPVSSDMDARNERGRLGALFMTASKTAVVLGLPVCIGFIVLGGRFISLWMGESYAPTSGKVLIVLATAHLVGLPHYTISAVLYGLGKHRIIAMLRVLEATANVALSVILVQRYGLVGVALGTLIPHVIVAGGVLPAVMPSVLPISLRSYYIATYVRPLLASIPFWAVCCFIEMVVAPKTLWFFFAIGGAGLVTYVVPCWCVSLSADERRQVRNRVRVAFRH
jgi:O-antigen/teichoic acid export membrane protein